MTASAALTVAEISASHDGRLADLAAALRAAGHEPNVCSVAFELASAELLLVAEQASRIVGAMLALPSAGGLGLLALPLAILPTEPDPKRIEDALMTALPPALRHRGQALAYALVPPGDEVNASLLHRHGFLRLTELSYLYRGVAEVASVAKGSLDRIPYSASVHAEFASTLLATYEGSLDCPELDGLRSVDEVLAGHAAVGVSGRRRWSLLCLAGTPAGVELLAELPEEGGVELVYLGLIPAARRQGHGQRLLRQCLRELAEQGWRRLTLAVDTRNLPAGRLYRSLGFRESDRRTIWWKSLRCPQAQFST